MLLLVGMISSEINMMLRAAFLDWVAAGKPRQGPVFVLMNRSRAAFKLAMRYCKQHEDMIRADNLANSIADKEYGAF